MNIKIKIYVRAIEAGIFLNAEILFTYLKKHRVLNWIVLFSLKSEPNAVKTCASEQLSF